MVKAPTPTPKAWPEWVSGQMLTRVGSERSSCVFERSQQYRQRLRSMSSRIILLETTQVIGESALFRDSGSR